MRDVQKCLRHIFDVTKKENPAPVVFSAYNFGNYLLHANKTIEKMEKKEKPKSAREGRSCSSTIGAEESPAPLQQSESTTSEATLKLEQSTSTHDRSSQSRLTRFPVPSDLSSERRRGDFDFLIVSQGHGCVAIEVKAVGFYVLPVTLDDLGKRVDHGCQQLYKQEDVLRHIFGEILQPGERDNPDTSCQSQDQGHVVLPVTKVLALPNIKRTRLTELLKHDTSLNEVKYRVSLHFCAETVKGGTGVGSVLDFKMKL
jgi:hypothetical protein